MPHRRQAAVGLGDRALPGMAPALRAVGAGLLGATQPRAMARIRRQPAAARAMPQRLATALATVLATAALAAYPTTVQLPLGSPAPPAGVTPLRGVHWLALEVVVEAVAVVGSPTLTRVARLLVATLLTMNRGTTLRPVDSM